MLMHALIIKGDTKVEREYACLNKEYVLNIMMHLTTGVCSNALFLWSCISINLWAHTSVVNILLAAYL